MSQEKGGNNGNAHHNGHRGNGNGNGNGHQQQQKSWKPRPPKTSGHIELPKEEDESWVKWASGKAGKIFSGTSAVDFAFWMQAFQMTAMVLGVWDMIRPPDSAVQAVTAAIHASGAIAPTRAMDAIIEDMFTAARPEEPSETVSQRIMNERLINLADHMQQRIYDIDSSPISAAQRVSQIDAVQKDWTEKRFVIENSRVQIEMHLITALANWDRSRRHHEEKVGKCFKLFTGHLSDGPLSLIREDLMNGRFRSAMLTLHMRYTSGVGGVQNVLTLQKLLNSVTWDPKKMSPLEFIDKFDTLISLYSSAGTNVNEVTRNAYIYNALQAAQDPTYKRDIEKANDDGLPMQWLIDRLSRTNSQTHLKKTLKRDRSTSKVAGQKYRDTIRPDPYGEEAEFAGMVQDKRARSGHCTNNNCWSCGESSQEEHYAMIVTCAKCGRTGHSEKECWSGLTCEKCKRVGHPAEACRTRMDGASPSPVKKEMVKKGKGPVTFKVNV
eukprot:gene36255-44724_t